METIYAVINGDDTDGEKIRQAGEILKAGGLVAFPTETVYGLGGDALNPDSSRKIYAAKGRPSDNPLIVHICRWEDIYRIADVLSAQDDVAVLRRTDYIEAPKENGYRSLHLVVSVPVFLSGGSVPVPVEVQIRTIAMDFWASLEHQIRYKSTEAIRDDDALRAELKRCAEESAALDLRMQEIYRRLKEGREDT